MDKVREVQVHSILGGGGTALPPVLPLWVKAWERYIESMTNLASVIDHALLHPTLTDEELREGCRIARELSLKCVCVKPCAIPLAVKYLQDSGVVVGTVIGFPHGSTAPEVKAFEAEWSCRQGARELDMVVNVGKVLSADWDFVRDDIQGVLQVARRHSAVLKVIFETDYVTDRETKMRLCEVCSALCVDFVKTSTGFAFVKTQGGGYGYQGATVEDVRLLRNCCPPSVQVKASGGIRTWEDTQRMLQAGATRLGTSASETILQGATSRQEGY